MRKTRILASALLGQVDQHASVSMRHAFPDALKRPGRTHSGFQGKWTPPSARQSPSLASVLCVDTFTHLPPRRKRPETFPICERLTMYACSVRVERAAWSG